ncbi:hypothetical protein OV203_00225 [Nannocystis sp. ILAH1]|uniref:hypothetical protein n=1 Tax=Nannocystis sp. ILAH1 TaxID=2996789 RepID=UPI0022700C9F|nr:hypothetical protein [Nannocystis sp. ILAH1]MCY0985534.1 hypothetical protein [Nannocystis sp. ILAH1]
MTPGTGVAERPRGRVRCHVCGTRWSVRPGPPESPRTEAEACPACDAPLKLVAPLGEGLARGLVLLAAGFPAEQKHFRTIGRYLAEFTLTEGDIEQLLALAAALDYDAWAADNARRLRARDSARVRAVSRFLPRLAALAESGALVQAIAPAAVRLKRRYRAERERHLAVFADRKARG